MNSIHAIIDELSIMKDCIVVRGWAVDTDWPGAVDYLCLTIDHGRKEIYLSPNEQRLKVNDKFKLMPRWTVGFNYRIPMAMAHETVSKNGIAVYFRSRMKRAEPSVPVKVNYYPEKLIPNDNLENVLKAIVCGYERGGTTLLLQLLTNHPMLSSGFEGGFLLADNPSSFRKKCYQDYNGSMLINGWKVTPDEINNYICDVDNFYELYKRLREVSRVVINKEAYLIDKTPRYLQYIDRIHMRYPNLKKIIIVRNPSATIWSWLKRYEKRELNGRKFVLQSCERYQKYYEGYQRLVESYGKPASIFLLRYEDLCLKPEACMKAVFQFLGLNFDPNFVQLRKTHHKNVFGSKIDVQFLEEYRSQMSYDFINLIEDKTKNCWNDDAVFFIPS